MKKFLLFLVINTIGLVMAFLLACQTTPASMPVYSSQLNAGVDAAAYNRGRNLALTDCASCHRIYYPKEYTAAEWKRIMPPMGKRASLSAEDVEDLLIYYTENGKPE